MADITNGITVSFLNTPQAVDDYYASSLTGLTEDTLAAGVLTLDVMVNDLGGKAKTLYSIDDANLSDDQSLYAYDLLQKDALTNGASVPEYSTFGAKIWIENGKIKYDAGTISGTHLDNINQLGAGESLIDTFTYAIRMSNGAISWATVSVQIGGVNDAPTISAADDSGSVTEDDADPTLSATGTITFDDVDVSDTHTVSTTADAGNTLGGTLSASMTDPASGAGDGTVTWTYEVANSATQYLAEGETAIETFTVTIDDGNGGTVDQVVTVTVTGTNDDPTISLADDSASLTEDESDPTLSATGTIAFEDIDLSDGHTVSTAADAGNTLGGILSAVVTDPASGVGDGTVTWTYEVANSAAQFLAIGQTATETFTVTIEDGNGGTVDQIVTISVTGTNDAPIVTDVSALADEDGAAVTGSFAGDDVDSDDDGASLTYAITSVPSEGSVINNGDGTFTFDPGTDFQDLAAGETRQVSFAYGATDSHGAVSSAGTVTVTVTGTNDIPVVSDVSASADEDGAAVTGSFVGDDVDSDDDGASLIYAITSTPSEGSVVNNGDGTFTFDPGGDFQDLAEGETRQVTFDYEATDIHGAVSNTGTVTVTVTGANDNPVVTDVSTSAVEDGATVTEGFAGDDVDSDDDGTTLTYAITSTPSEGSVVNNGDGTFTFDPGADFQDLAEGETREVTFAYEATDSHGAVSNSGTVTVTVTGTNDAPTITSNGGGNEDSPSVAENTTVVTTVTATDVDAGAVLKYSIAGGADASLFKIDETNGDLSFLAAPNFESPGDAGGNNVYDVIVQASDGSLADTQTLHVTVTDVNEQPNAGADFAANVPEDVNDVAVLATVVGTDPDTGGGNDGASNFENLTYSIAPGGDPSGLFEINALTGEISLVAGKTLDFETAQSHVVTVRVTDGPGLFDDTNVTINVTDVAENIDPTSKNDRWVLSNLGSPLTIPTLWFLNNDTDADGDTLKITHINGIAVVNGAVIASDFTANVSGGVLTSLTYDGTPSGTSASFTYTVSDGNGGSSTAAVNVDFVTTTTKDNIINLETAADYDFSYIDSLQGGDTLTGGITLVGTAGVDTFLGNNNEDTLSGNVGDDFLFGNENTDSLSGGDGSDYLDGGNGKDTSQGGSGNDTLIWDATDPLVDGGTDFDTLRVSGSLNLTPVPDAQLENIERIDLTDYGADVTAEILTLNAQDVLDLEASGNKLYIMGNETGTKDSVDIDASLTTVGATTVLDGVTYVAYTGDPGGTPVTVFIEQGLNVIP